LRDAAAVLFTCEEERLLARQSFSPYRANEKIVSLGASRPHVDRTFTESFFLRFPETRNKRLLLLMGRLHPKKACDLVIEAFAAVLASDSRWHLVFAGPDQIGWQANLVRLAERCNVASRITWAGFVAGDIKLGALQSAEALFLPSHDENFGVVVAEALACGVPALISNRVNIWREVIQDGAGMVEEDTAAGARALLERWIHASQSSRDAMRLAARLSFDRRFEIGKATDCLISTLRAAIDEATEPLLPSRDPPGAYAPPHP
jgi:glycosyltransferase involved in cell wall biosynthesis